MIIFKKARDLAQHLKTLKLKGKTLGFVPTMGALHEGHLSLIQISKAHSDISVVSIFVNPTQFNDKEDFDKYPITTETDLELLERQAVEILFLPSVEEIYPTGYQANNYELGALENVLEGSFRPGHFQGVCQVLDRLLSITQPDLMVMGQKDYQQIMVVKKMIELTDKPVQLIIGPTLRDQSGLAKSSRNTRLTPEQKTQAKALFQSLNYVRDHLKVGVDLEKLTRQAANQLLANGFLRFDYFSVCRQGDLTPIREYQPGLSLIILVAAYIGNVRLIDNILVS